MKRALLVACVLVWGCSDAVEEGSTIDTESYLTLVSGGWTMPPGQEGYTCVRATVPEDMWIREFKPIAPPGTHHTALSATPGDEPDGVFPCGPDTNGFQFLFGSGVGTEPFTLPDGVGFKLYKGQRIILNLHLYNTSTSDLTGTSGIEVKLARPEDVIHEAETRYVLGFELEVPPGTSSSEVSCHVQYETTIFGAFPHMHRMGAHMKGMAKQPDGSETVFHDAPYTFEEQLDYLVDPPLTVAPNSVIKGQCTFENTTADTIVFGDSSDDEMCVLGVYVYPPGGGLSLCFE